MELERHAGKWIMTIFILGWSNPLKCIKKIIIITLVLAQKLYFTFTLTLYLTHQANPLFIILFLLLVFFVSKNVSTKNISAMKWVQCVNLSVCVCVCVCVLSSSGSKVLVHFVNQSGIKSSVFVTEGETLLDIVIKKNLDISGFGNETICVILASCDQSSPICFKCVCYGTFASVMMFPLLVFHLTYSKPFWYA